MDKEVQKSPVRLKPRIVTVSCRTALTRTGGFLSGFTHTVQPYVGCAFGSGCGVYCYVAQSPVHRFQGRGQPWGAYVYVKVNVATVLRDELARLAAAGKLDEARIFMSSATDPYQGVEARAQRTRACLEAFVDYPPGLLVVQTRAPLAERDFDLLAALGDRTWLSVTIETDDEILRRALTPGTPSLAGRRRLVERARECGLNVQVAVAPCLPLRDADAFARWLAEVADRVVVDTFTSGDGLQGKRTARSPLPARFAALGLGDWRDESEARSLYRTLQRLMGPARVGWSAEGFNRVVERDQPERRSLWRPCSVRSKPEGNTFSGKNLSLRSSGSKKPWRSPSSNRAERQKPC